LKILSFTFTFPLLSSLPVVFFFFCCGEDPFFSERYPFFSPSFRVIPKKLPYLDHARPSREFHDDPRTPPSKVWSASFNKERSMVSNRYQNRPGRPERLSFPIVKPDLLRTFLPSDELFINSSERANARLVEEMRRRPPRPGPFRKYFNLLFLQAFLSPLSYSSSLSDAILRDYYASPALNLRSQWIFLSAIEIASYEVQHMRNF